MSRKLQVFASDNDDVGSAQDLLSDDWGQTAQQVTATVDDDSLKNKIEILLENSDMVRV